MRYIFVDLGAYDGDSIKTFMQIKTLPVEPKQFSIFAFEPNPVFEKPLKNLQKTLDNFIMFRPEAAWTEATTLTFAKDKSESPMGSTLMSSKKHLWDNSPHIEVTAFDFSDYVKQFADDYVIVKMDIEGAEFPVLEKMIAEGTDSMMNELWVEMHPNKVTDYTTTYSNELKAKLKCIVKDWH